MSLAQQGSARLPRTFEPEHYFLTFTPDFEKRTFRGHMEAVGKVLEDTRRIVLHADKELAIKEAAVLQGDEYITPEKISRDEEEQVLTLVFSEGLIQGDAHVVIDFDGVLNSDMAGFYASTYRRADGSEGILGTTQFEATDARRAFPCWDEPALKATFEVLFEIPENLTVISNMLPREERPAGDGKRLVHFETTPKMSTYLLAWVIGELEHIEAYTKDGVLVRVFTTPGKKEQGRFALGAAVKMLEFYNEYFGIQYPLPKSDLVAIPDFAAGAMENWGLVTYREIAILVDSAHTSEHAKQWVALVVAHELAHQWFGNLVTMEWWTHLWLNEGFASWVEYLGVDAVFPEWNIWEHFVSADYARALAKDSLRNTHLIEVPVQHTREISEIFDALSYSKGASVIRMLDAFLGRETFRQGLHLYLTRHQYGNATTDDLWAALAEVSGKPVGEMMDTWTKQLGYPVVMFGKKTDRGAHTYEQQRFLQSGMPLTPEEKAQMWQVSFPLYAPGGAVDTVLLSRQKGALTLPEHASPKLNAGQIAFVRTVYPPEARDALKKMVEEGRLSAIDRFGLVNDADALAQAGVIPTTELLSLLEVYQHEEDLIVWRDVLSTLAGISFILPSRGEVRDTFDTYSRYLLEEIVQKLGWEERVAESQKDRILRPSVLYAYGKYGDADIRREAVRRFEEFLEHPNSLPPDFYVPVFHLAAVAGNRNTFEKLMAAYQRADQPELKTELLAALGSFRDEALIRRALDFSLSEEVRRQDGMRIPRMLAANEVCGELGWESLRDQWDAYKKRYERSLTVMLYILEPVLGAFKTEDRAHEVEEFFKKNPYPQGIRTIEQGLEKTRSRARWIARDCDAVVGWLHGWHARS